MVPDSDIKLVFRVYNVLAQTAYVKMASPDVRGGTTFQSALAYS